MYPRSTEADLLVQNRYRLVRPLGKGGMGAVYEAFDVRLNRVVALKEMLGETEELRRAFEREAQLLGNLRHPALPKVLDHFEEGERLFLVMEFIPGEDLARTLDLHDAKSADQSSQAGDGSSSTVSPTPFDPELVLRWAEQLLDALEYLHENGVLHRDIKPANIKLLSPSQIVLLDFGLAKGSVGQMRNTASRSLLGYSPNYSALEQIQGVGTDHRSDLYSLGATLYHLLTGVRPPDAVARASAIVNGRTDPLKPASDINRQVTIGVSSTLIRAMALDIEQRPASANEMRRALGAPISSTSAVTVPSLDANEITRLGAPRAYPARPSPSRPKHNRLEIPVSDSEETVVRRRGTSSLFWRITALTGAIGVLLAAAYVWSIVDRQEIFIVAPETTTESPAPIATSEANLNRNTGIESASNEVPPTPAELAARENLAKKNISFSGESFTRMINDGNRSAVDLLLDAGIDPNLKTSVGRPVLLDAAMKGSDNITRRLLIHGADINATDPEGSTALMEATGRAHKNTVAMLIARGADLNRTDREGRTALMRAAAEGHGDVVRILLDHGARADLKDRQGRDARALADKNGHSGVVKLLSRTGGTPR